MPIKATGETARGSNHRCRTIWEVHLVEWTLVFLSVGVTGCGETSLKSSWKSGESQINGQNTAWYEAATPLEDKRTAVVVMNDSTDLYIGLRTTDPNLKRLIMRTGITWWFDSTDSEEKTFGIRYPVGGRGFPHGGTNEGEPPESEKMPQPSNSIDLDLYSSEDRHERMSKVAAGIDARTFESRDTLYYEIVVPLIASDSHPFAIGAKPGTVIGVGVETVLERPRRAPHEEFEGVGGTLEGGYGGRGGGGMRPPGGMGGHGRGERMEARPEPLSDWMKVQLARGT